MTRDERTQAAALKRFIRFGYDRDGRRFVDQLEWLIAHEPRTVLTPAQKHFLQSLCYRYRRQLAGRVDAALIPSAPPADLPEAIPQQADILNRAWQAARPSK